MQPLKYKVGDEVWFKDTPTYLKGIIETINGDLHIVKYNKNDRLYCGKEELYPTRAALLEDLAKEIKS